jgi:hypothetical protein
LRGADGTRLERFGDNAVDIGRQAAFAATGQFHPVAASSSA